jgi:hypothetical protein
MSLLQTVTSLLLLHFSRLLLISSGGSSSLFYTFLAENGLPEITDGVLATFIFTVTTVTTNIKNILKPASGKCFSFVTASRQTPLGVTLLSQAVATRNKRCHKLCNILINCISFSYTICDSRPPENLYLRIFHSKNKFYYYA